MNPQEADSFSELWTSLITIAAKIWPDYTITTDERVSYIDITLRLQRPKGDTPQG